MDANENLKFQTLSILSGIFEDVVREIGLAVEELFKDAPSCQVSKLQSELSNALHPMKMEAVMKVCQLFQSLNPHRDTEDTMSPPACPASPSNKSETKRTKQAEPESQKASTEDEIIVVFKSEPLDDESYTLQFGSLTEAAIQEEKSTPYERKQQPGKRPWSKYRSTEEDETGNSSPGCVDEPKRDIGQPETPQSDSDEQSYATGSHLSSHVQTLAEEMTFACDECGATFATAGSLKRHTAVGHKAPLECATCGKAFDTPYLLKVHVRLHTGERPYKCSQCPKAFRMFNDLGRHKAVHSGERSFVCETCGACFSIRGNLNRHYLTHTGERPYICELCGKSYTQPSTLKTHMASHDESMSSKFTCDLCGKGFPFNHMLNAHRRLKHPPSSANIVAGDVKCEVCSEVFRSVRLLATHEQVHSGDRRHRCVRCKKDFFHKSSLDDHMRVHVQGKHICPVCGRGYGNKYTMVYHMRVHMEGKSVVCHICGKRFLSNQALEIHQRSHTGEKPFECDTCGKGFGSAGNLTRHKLVHTGERPYSCGVCGKRFNQQVAVEFHMQVHTGIRPYSCKRCGKGFSDSRLYKKHTCDV